MQAARERTPEEARRRGGLEPIRRPALEECEWIGRVPVWRCAPCGFSERGRLGLEAGIPHHGEPRRSTQCRPNAAPTQRARADEQEGGN